jgi:hypothetical protein
MISQSLYEDAISRLAAQSDAVGRLAQDSGGFAAVVAAFESKDPNAFRWVLERLELVPHCELICEWVGIKLGVLRCIEVCGPPIEKMELPSLQQFARAIVQLSSNEKLLRRVVDAVSRGDGNDYRAALAELKLNNFCHLLCHWVYSTVFRRICEVVCTPPSVFLPDAVTEIRAAGKVLASLTAKDKTFDAIGKATAALNWETLKSSLNEAGFSFGCEIICRLICTWRCMWVCRELCEIRPPVLTGVYAIEETRNFALASRQLAGQPRALGDLVSAVQSRDAKSYGEIIARFGLGPYCLQVCAWVGSVICSEFCIRVCPPQSGIAPLFTKVGIYSIGPIPNDFNANGTTVSGSLAFTQTIPLIGLLPDGAAPQQLKYRFTYQKYSGVSPNPNPIVPITSAMVPPTIIGSLEYTYWTGTEWKLWFTDFSVNKPGAMWSIPQEFGPPLSVSVDTDMDSNGWITLPSGLNNSGPGQRGLFVPTGTLIKLDTTQLTNEISDLTGATPLKAGDTIPPGDLSAKPVFQINFEAQTVVGSTPVGSNSLNAIALSNTKFTYIRHPEWPGSPPLGVGDGSTTSFTGTLTPPVLPGSIQVIAGAVIGTDNGVGAISGAGISSGTINYATGAISVTYAAAPAAGVQVLVDYSPTTNQILVLSLDILELKTAGGCTELHDTIHALYTAYHPYLGSCEVFLQGPWVSTMTIPPGGTISLPVPNISSGAAGSPFDMTGLPPCAYILWLNATLNLTCGDGPVYGTFSDYIAFCTR